MADRRTDLICLIRPAALLTLQKGQCRGWQTPVCDGNRGATGTVRTTRAKTLGCSRS